MEYGIFILFALYLAPTFVAAARQHPHFGLLTLFNLGLGWTGVGWLAALLWAAPPLRTWKPSRAGTSHKAKARPLRVISADSVDDSQRQRRRRVPTTPLSLMAVTGVLAVGLALAGDASLQSTIFPAPYPVEIVRVSSTDLRAGPGSAHATTGTLREGCRVQVLERKGGWQRIWKTSQCASLSSGRSEGWTPRNTTRRASFSARSPDRRASLNERTVASRVAHEGAGKSLAARRQLSFLT